MTRPQLRDRLIFAYSVVGITCFGELHQRHIESYSRNTNLMFMVADLPTPSFRRSTRDYEELLFKVLSARIRFSISDSMERNLNLFLNPAGMTRRFPIRIR